MIVLSPTGAALTSSPKNSSGSIALTSIGFSNTSPSSTFSTSTKSAGPMSSGFISASSASFSALSFSSLSRANLNSSAFFSASRLLFSANFFSSSDLRLSSSRVWRIDFSTKSKSFLRPKSLFLYQSVDHKWYSFQPRPVRTCSRSLSLSRATLLEAYIFPSVVIPNMYLPGFSSSTIAKSTLKPAQPICLSTVYPFSSKKLAIASSNGSLVCSSAS